MSGLESKLFPEDRDWLSNTYGSTEEAFRVAEYFAQYVRRRWPQKGAQNSNEGHGHLYLEFVDVEFRPEKELPRKLVHLGFGTETLSILIPDKNYTLEEQESLRDYYQQKYATIVKESHARINALLWQTFSDSEKTEILKLFDGVESFEASIKKAIGEDIKRLANEAEQKALQTQTKSSSKEE